MRICLFVICICLTVAVSGCGRSRDPLGVYVSVIRLPGSGEQWNETVDFKPSGVCYYDDALTVALYQWSRRGNTITIS